VYKFNDKKDKSFLFLHIDINLKDKTKALNDSLAESSR